MLLFPLWGGVGGGGRRMRHCRTVIPRPPTPTLPHREGGRRSSCARGNAHNWRGEPVAAARHGRNNDLLAVTDRVANLTDAAHQRFVGYGHIRPDRLEQLLLGHQAIGILHKIAQQLEVLGAKRNLAIGGSQRVPRDIQRISLESEHLVAASLIAVPRAGWRGKFQAKLQALYAKLQGSVRTAARRYGRIGANGWASRVIHLNDAPAALGIWRHFMKLPRRTFLQVAGAAAVAPAFLRAATAESYPSRAITMIVPFPAGGGTDAVARLLAERMKESLGQPIIIENVSGANGSIGVGRLARAKPDGYTIDLANQGAHVLNAALYSLPYDVINDFEPISPIVAIPVVLFAKKTIPANDLNEFVI